MTIWVAGSEDVPDLLVMGRKFHEAGKLPGRFTDDAFRKHLSVLFEIGAVLRTQKGMIGGAVICASYDPNYKIAVESFWWAEDGQGRRLLSAFERHFQGADEIRMTTLSEIPRSDALVRRRGYRPVETSYVRNVSWH